MTTLQAQLVVAGHKEKRQGWDDYRKIVLRADKAEPGDAKRILEVCALLNIDMADVELDARAYQKMPTLVAHAAECKALEKQRAKLHAKTKKRETEIKEITVGHARELKSMRGELAGIAHRLSIAEVARAQVEATRARSWRIFDQPSPAPSVENITGAVHPEELRRWIASEPPTMSYVHTGGDRDVHAALRGAGYEPGEPGVWVLNGTEPEKV